METLNASAVYGDTEHECIDVIGVYGEVASITSETQEITKPIDRR